MSLKTYFHDAVTELHRVTWPTQRQAIQIVGIVIVFVAIAAVVFGALDQLLAAGYSYLLSISK